MLKNTIIKIINDINDKKKLKDKGYLSLDEIYLKYTPSNPIIVDVGANKGESIKKFSNILSNPTIHSFEPNSDEFKELQKKYGNKNNIFLNNYALGDKKEVKKFNIASKSANSSFNNLNLGTDWLKIRSKQLNTTQEKYITKIEKVNVTTLDNYVQEKSIDRIDLLKIDTQGYEDKVLAGSLETIKKNKISIILTEIIFDDVYNKYFSFSDIEKFIIPYNFRMVGIHLQNNNLFSGLVFASNVLYFNKNKFNNI